MSEDTADDDGLGPAQIRGFGILLLVLSVPITTFGTVVFFWSIQRTGGIVLWTVVPLALGIGCIGFGIAGYLKGAAAPGETA